MKIIIQTQRLHLVEFSEQDTEGFFKMNNNPKVLQFTGDQAFKTETDASLFLQNYNHYQRYGYGRWTIRRKTDNAYLGFCGLKYDEATKEVDLGYRLDRAFWGNGYATEAALACLNYGLKVLSLTRIIGRAQVENKASIKVLEKIGMQFLREFDFDGKVGVIYEKK